MFFDQGKIKNKTDAATRKVLSKFGAFVRQTAKRSIRTRKGTSKPGNPPFSHTGRLKKYIYFGYDLNRRSVVIGPVVASGTSGKGGRGGRGGKAPQALESGGTVRLPDGRNAKIRPRPFMGPALAAELPKVPSLWRDCIR
jgi:hypothetical protein